MLSEESAVNSDNMRSREISFRSLSYRSIAVLSAVIIVVLLLFGARVLPRTLDSSMDFKLLYVASAAWAQGLNPYDNKILDNLWVEGGNSITTKPGLASLYPITTYAMLSPLSILSWENAKLIWLFINIFACMLIWVGMVKILKINITDWPCIVLLAAFLALIPVQNCIFQGQPVLVVLSLMVFSILFFMDGFDLFSGVFLGLALGLKPQVGLFLLVYYLIKGRWKTATLTVITTLILVLLAIFRLGFEDLSWLSTWQNKIQATYLAINGLDNHYFLLNLQYPLNVLISYKNINNLIIITFMLVCLFLFFLYCCKRSDAYHDLLEISFLALISLLPFYHRNYEAAILIFPLSYGIFMTSRCSDRWAKIILLTICPFLIPGPALLLELDKQGYVPAALAKSLLWQAVILPHQVWLLVILSSLLIFIMYRQSLE